MDRCTKFKVFNLLLLFCVANFFIYRIFSGGSMLLFSSLTDTTPTALIPRVVSNASAVKVTGQLSNINDNNAQIQQQSKDNENTQSSGTSLADVSSKSDESSNSQGNANSGASADNTANNKDHSDKTDTESNTQITDSSSSSAGSGGGDAPTSLAEDLPMCPLVPPALNGALATYTEAVEFAKTAEQNEGLQKGGRFKPPNCVARHRVAIIIPYRNREEHLKIFLNNLHPILIRQQLDYGIYVIDQALPGRFNRAMLMNIGYKEAMDRYDYQCAIFHDVDLVPENDKNIYSCPEQPRHMSAAIDKFKYRLPYAKIFGGASALTKEQFVKVNGFSNLYFGWGGEDDDMAMRIGAKGYSITRYPMEIARYKMIKHTKEKHNERNPKRFELLRSAKRRMSTDGLNSLQYTVQEVEEAPTHTKIKVLIDEKKVLGSVS